jgi:hypothetical protein
MDRHRPSVGEAASLASKPLCGGRRSPAGEAFLMSAPIVATF